MPPPARRTLTALTEAVLPRSDGFYLPIEGEVAAGIERYVAGLPRPMRFGFAAALFALEVSPLAAAGRPVLFSRAGLALRRRVVERWLGSRFAPVRELMGVMSGLVALHFYDDPRVMDHLGYFIEDHIRQVNAHPPVPAAETVRIGGAGR